MDASYSVEVFTASTLENILIFNQNIVGLIYSISLFITAPGIKTVFTTVAGGGSRDNVTYRDWDRNNTPYDAPVTRRIE